ncbi:monooxygenase [Apiospora sp. TS-2023a]
MERSPHPDTGRLDVIVVGAGLCGLSMAISMAQAGHQVSVFEAHHSLHEFGAGLQSSPNGTRIYAELGLTEALKPIATAPEVLQISRFDGAVLARRERYDEEVMGRYGFPLWTLPRVGLQARLLDRAVELGAEISFSSTVVDVNSAGPFIELENGDQRRGDLVVIADGVWSKLRSVVVGQTVDPQPTGDMAYRITLDRDQIQDRELRDWLEGPRVQIWLGPGTHAAGYSIRQGKQFNLALLALDDFQDKETWVRGKMEELQERFRGWDPLLGKMLEQVKEVAKWRLMHIPVLPTWRSENGRVVMSGDCCHAILPYMAQGLTMALEDCATLGSLMRHVTSPDQLLAATSMYDQLRKARTARLLEETKRQGAELHLDDGEAQRKRDADLAQSLQPGSDWTHPKAQSWIWSYNAADEAEKAYRNSPF